MLRARSPVRGPCSPPSSFVAVTATAAGGAGGTAAAAACARVTTVIQGLVNSDATEPNRFGGEVGGTIVDVEKHPQHI